MLQHQAVKRQTSIKTKVALATLVTVSIVLVSVSSALFFYFSNMLRESIFQQQFSMVSEIAEQLNGRIQLARFQLSLAASEIDSRVLADPEELQHVLTQLSPINMVFDAGFVVIGTDGHVVAENMGFTDLLGKDLSHRDYVREALRSGKPYISAPFRFILRPNNPLIAVVTPIRDNNDHIICLLAGYHSLGNDQFLTSMSPKGLGNGGYLYIVDNRTILMHPDNAQVMKTIPEGSDRGIDLALKGMEGSLDNVNFKGQRMLSSFKKVGETGWILGADTPYDNAFGHLKKLAANAILIAAVGILFSLLVLWYVTRRLTLPIRRLTAHVDAVTDKADDWRPIDLRTGDEIEHLADAFNGIMAEVHGTKQLLKDEKAFYQGIIQNAAAPMFVIDSNHKIVFWNNALAKLTGKSSFQMTGTKLQWTPFYPTKRPVLADLVIDQTLHRVDELYSSHSSSLLIEGALRAEGWYENIGGKRRYIFFEAAPIRNSSNELVAVVETLEDITDRKLAEEATAAHNLFLQEIMDAIPNPVYFKDVNGSYLGCNSAFISFFGKTAAEIIGRTLLDIMPEYYAGQSIQKDRAIIESGSSIRYETELVSGDGMVRSVLASKAPFSHADGSLGGIVGAFVDITERKAVEAELTQSRKELEAKHGELGQLFEQVAYAKREWEQTLDHLRDYIILTDAEHRIRRCNKLLAEDTGRSITDLIGMDWRDLIVEAGFSFVTFNGTAGEIFNQRSRRSFDITVYAIKGEAKLTGYVVSINDTTELRCAGQELEKAYDELKDAQLQIFQQEKMASIGQLAAGVAHEINNPMGFISSNLSTLNKYIERLAEFIAAGDQAFAACAGSTEIDKLKEVRKRLKIDYIMDDSRQLIAESQDGAGRVRRIVQDLKSFSRVDQAETALINLNEALETTINIAWNEIKYVATLNREFGDIPMIKCYPQQLNQVFLNLLVNAAHALGENQGVITVRTWDEGTYVLVSVADTGCGIPDEIRQRIFEPFFTTKEVGKGTGLGLSISYDIIRKHGGEITVESEVGRGTTFIVRLPVEPPIQKEEAP